MAIKGQTIWVTGASSGIGQEAARQFAKLGNRVILSARSEEKLRNFASELPEDSNPIILPLDLSDETSITKAIDGLITDRAIPNLVFHAGGISQRSYLIDTSLEVDRRIMEVNYFGTISLTKKILPEMLKQGGGQFAVVSSLVGLFGYGVRSAYSASKHALHGFFESLDIELGDSGFTSTMICPGGVQTNISKNALMGDGKESGVMDEMQSGGMPVDEAVSKMITAIENKRKLIIIGSFKEKLGVFLSKHFPSVFFKIASKQNPRGTVKL